MAAESPQPPEIARFAISETGVASDRVAELGESLADVIQSLSDDPGSEGLLAETGDQLPYSFDYEGLLDDDENLGPLTYRGEVVDTGDTSGRPEPIVVDGVPRAIAFTGIDGVRRAWYLHYNPKPNAS